MLSGEVPKTAYLYNGQYGVATNANGLYYMRTRYYNVSIKKFINQDVSGETLVPATKSQKGVTPNPLEVQIDHIDLRSKGGTNSYSNAQVLSRYENIKRSDK